VHNFRTLRLLVTLTVKFMRPPCSFYQIIIGSILYYCTPTAGQWVGRQVPGRQILGKKSVARLRNNSDKRSVSKVVRAMPSAKQQNCKHVYNNRCFLWGSCRRFIGDSEDRLQSVTADKPWVKDTKPSRKGFVRNQPWSVNRYWSFMCYSFLLLLVGWDWVHLVLRPLLAYCTSPRW
jgi:hypothetical protein